MTIQRNFRKKRTGLVISTKMNKTIVVLETKRVNHPRYGKSVIKYKKYMVHDEKNVSNKGDNVIIMETRPLSKYKRWRLIKKI